MGYTTDFEGHFAITPPLTPEHRCYLLAFSGTRRMQREAHLVEKYRDRDRSLVGLPVGLEGGYFVGGGGYAGQANDASIIDYNHPPTGQPGLWCQWVPNDDGSRLEWNGAEKFYYYVEWLEYLIEHFFTPWGYVLNGVVRWRGEDFDDIGRLIVDHNVVSFGGQLRLW